MTKTKVLTWLIPLVILIFALAFISGCVPREKEEGVIKIGATLALTGPLSYKGNYERKGMELAVDEINNNGGINGKKLVLIVEDNKGDPKEAVTNVNKLIDVDGVVTVLSAFTHISSAIAPIIIEKNNVLIYESTVSSIAKKSDNIFKDYYSMKDVGKMFARAASKEGIKSIGLLYPISEWGEDFKSGFEEEAKNLGINVTVVEPFDFSASDLRTEILKIKDKEVDGIASVGLEKHNILMLRAINDLNLLDKKLFMLELLTKNINDDPISINVINKTHAISSWYFFDPSSNDQKTKNFVEKYKEKYNEEPTADAAYFYDDIYVLSNVLKICDKKNQLNTNCIIEELKKVKNYEGVAGLLSFNNEGVSNRPLKLYQFVGGQWKNYEME